MLVLLYAFMLMAVDDGHYGRRAAVRCGQIERLLWLANVVFISFRAVAKGSIPDWICLLSYGPSFYSESPLSS
jgi:hypothetical protein